jgi:putative heme degradation protein
MTARTQHKRERLDVSPIEILERLPSIGRLMINSENLGATHERIGKVEKVRLLDGWIVCEGAEHNSRIELAAIDTITVDRTSVMREKSYPRIELRDKDGKTICNITGFEGLEPFDSVLGEFPQGSELPLEERKSGASAERKELDENDIGLTPFSAAERNGGQISVEFRQPSFWQAWEGDAPKINPAMGYINIILPDFHLHLQGGSVTDWRCEADGEQTRFIALGEEGETGLTVSGATANFG